MHTGAANCAADGCGAACQGEQPHRPHDAWGANMGIRLSAKMRGALSGDWHESRTGYVNRCLRDRGSNKSFVACTEHMHGKTWMIGDRLTNRTDLRRRGFTAVRVIPSPRESLGVY
jgi:hypothetical protein